MSDGKRVAESAILERLQEWADLYLADWICDRHDVRSGSFCWGCQRQQQMREILNDIGESK